MSEGRTHTPIEETELFRVFVSVADEVWTIVRKWQPFERDTIGRQLVRAADGVGSNLVEGDGRYSDSEALQFFRYARGSAREARYFITRAAVRELMPAEQAKDLVSRINLGARQLNGLMSYRAKGVKRSVVREDVTNYGQSDPLAFCDPCFDRFDPYCLPLNAQRS